MVAAPFIDNLRATSPSIFCSLGILLTAASKIEPTVGEACLIVAICFGWFMLASIDAVARGFPTSNSFSDASLSGLMAIECIFGAIALVVLHVRGYSITELLPTPTWRGCLSGTLLCAAALCACWLVEQLFSQSQREAQPIVAIVENARPTLAFVMATSVLNGLYEETFLLGYLIRGFSAAGASFALGLSVVVRLLRPARPARGQCRQTDTSSAACQRHRVTSASGNGAARVPFGTARGGQWPNGHVLSGTSAQRHGLSADNGQADTSAADNRLERA